MNNKELAKLLLKHPIIKKINESQMWDKSVVSRVIAEELLKEANRAVFIQGMARRLAAQGEGEEAKRFHDQAIGLFTDQIKKLDDELIELDIGLDGADNNEIAAARIKEKNLKKEIADVKVALINFENSYEKAKNLPKVQEDEPEVSEAVEEVGSTLDQIEAKTKEFEKLAAEVESGSEDVVDDFYKVEGELQALRKKLSDEEENAADATKEPEQNQDAAPAKKLQQNIEKAAETVANVSLAAAGAALVSGPAAPAALAVSKVADIVSAGLDTAALTAAVLNDDQDAIISNGSSLAAGVAAALIPAGGVAKKASKEAVETLVKKVVEKGTKATIQKTIGAIKKDENKETKAEKVAKQVENKVVEKVREKLEGKTPEEQRAVVQKAAEAVGMDLNQKIGNLIGNFNQNLTTKSFDEKLEFLKNQRQIYEGGDLNLFKSTHKNAWKKMEKAGVTDEDLKKAIEASKEKAVKKIDSIEKFGGSEQTKVDGKNVDRNAAIDAAINDLSDISGNVINTAIDIAKAETDTSGKDIEGTVGAAFADKWIKDNNLEGLSLFQDKDFKAEFARLLEKPGETQGLESDNTESGDDADVSSSFIGNDNLDDSQSLQEEADVEDKQPEIKTVSKEESEKVREEVQQVIDALNKSGLLNDPLEKLLKTKLPKEEVTEEEAVESGTDAAQEDGKKESISKEEEYKGHIEVFDNFFSLDGANDGFMEQFLLKYQSQKLWQFIGELSKIAMEGEERALSPKPETSAAGVGTEEEEATDLNTGGNEETNLEEAWNPFKREEEDVVIPKEAKAELKTSLIALLGALKKLKGMTKSYEQNMMKSSANPALDGSSLMAQIQRFVPDIQDSIAKIVERSYESIIEQNRLKDLESKRTEEPQADEVPAEENAGEQELNELLREVFLEEEVGMSREDKIQIVDAKYQEMRREYKGAFRAILEAGERNKAIPAAEKMLEMAREEKFISMFPSALVGKSGKPHSVKEAVVTLSNLIQTFVQTMKDVVMLVKKDVIPAATLSSVVSDLTQISTQLEEYFKVNSKIDPELKAKLEKFLAKKPENQSLTDTPQQKSGGVMDTLKDLWNKLKEKFNWLSEELLKKISESIPKAELEPFLLKIEEMDITPDEKSRTIENIADVATWFNKLDELEQTAVRKYFQALKNFGVKHPAEKSLQEDKSAFIQSLLDAGFKGERKTFGGKSLKQLNPEERKAVLNLMKTQTEDFSNFIIYLFWDDKMADMLFDVLGSMPEPSSLDLGDDEDGDTDDPYDRIVNGPIQKYIRNKMGKAEEEDVSIPLTAFIENFAKNVEVFYRFELSESVLSKSKNMAKKLWSKMTKEDRRWASKIVEEIMKDLESKDHPILQDKNGFLKILVGSISKEAEDYVDFFKEMRITPSADLKSILKDIIKRKGKIDLEEPYGTIEEALKPIIAKILKEHHG